MYDLKQAALLAYRQLEKNLAKYGYAPISGTVGLWKHETRPTTFCVCVDDFGVKYFSEADGQHLINSLKIIINARPIGTENIIVVSHSTGNMLLVMSTSQCQSMLVTASVDLDINQKRHHNTHHTSTCQSNMGRKDSDTTQPHRMTPISLHNRKQQKSNPPLDHFYTMAEP